MRSTPLTAGTHWPEWAALLSLAACKLGLLVAFGPTWETDWGGYSDFADIILHDPNWITDSGLHDVARPLTLFRSIGYPLVVAAFRGVLGNGDTHLYAIIVFQIMASLAATAMVWRVARRLLSSRRWAMVAAAGHATAVTMLYDQSLLSDSLYASVFVLCWSVPMLGFLNQRRLNVMTMAGLGMLYGYSCLLRGTGTLFLVLVLPVVVAWAWVSCRHWGRVLAVAAFSVPVGLCVGGDMAWNHARTGHWIMTTGGQQVLVQPLMKAAARGHDVFDGDTPIDVLAKRHLRTYEFSEVKYIVAGLFSEYGIDSIASADLHKKVFLRAWAHHPFAMLENTINNFEESIIFQLFNPMDNAAFYFKLVTGKEIFKRTKDSISEIKNGNIAQLPILLMRSIFRIISYSSLLTLIVGGTILSVRAFQRRLSHDQTAIFWLCVIFFAYTLVLCAIHMVTRFMPAVAPAGMIAVLYFVQRGVCLRWRRLDGTTCHG